MCPAASRPGTPCCQQPRAHVMFPATEVSARRVPSPSSCLIASLRVPCATIRRPPSMPPPGPLNSMTQSGNGSGQVVLDDETVAPLNGAGSTFREVSSSGAGDRRSIRECPRKRLPISGGNLAGAGPRHPEAGRSGFPSVRYPRRAGPGVSRIFRFFFSPRTHVRAC